MIKLSDLPTEVASSIVADLPRESLVALTKTCKFLRELALRVLFKTMLISSVREGEWHENVNPIKRRARMNDPMNLLSSVAGAVDCVRELVVGIPPAEVKFKDWDSSTNPEEVTESILTEEMVDRLCALIKTMTNLQRFNMSFDSDFDYMIAYRVLSSLQGTSGLRKFGIGYTGGYATNKIKEFHDATGGKVFAFPVGLTDIEVNIEADAERCDGYPESMSEHERALDILTRSIILPSLSTVTRLALSVGIDLNGTQSCYSHYEMDLDDLAAAPLTDFSLTARKKEDTSDNIPKICRLWPGLQHLRVTEYWGAHRENGWCGGMDLLRFQKTWLEHMKSLQKLKTLFLSYDLEKDANDIQENIFDNEDDEDEEDEPYPAWEKRNTQRRLEVSKSLAEGIPVLEYVEWMNKMDDGNESNYHMQVTRDEEGKLIEVKADKEWWDEQGNDDEDDENEEDDQLSQGNFEGVFSLGEGEDAEGEDAEGEDTEGEDGEEEVEEENNEEGEEA